jgi:peptidoglycan/xylan/chitin deacetylase (PgdA/CDA1 family)
VFYFSKNEDRYRTLLPFFVGIDSSRAKLDLPVSLPVAGITIEETGNMAGVPVLLYHGIMENLDPNDDANTSVEVFEDQIKMLKDEGYTAIDTKDLYCYIHGMFNLPRKPVIISFDDGRIDSVKNSDPILRKYGFKAVMFIAVGKQNNKDKFFLSWDDLQNMQDSGRWDLEVHAGNGYHSSITIDEAGNKGYFASNKKWLGGEKRLETDEEYGQRLIDDIKQARHDIETHITDIDLISFAFPYGDYGEDAVNIDKDFAIRKNHDAVDYLFPISFGFDGTYGDNFNFFYFKETDPHLIKRLDVRETLTAGQLNKMLEIYVNKDIPFNLAKFDAYSIENMLPVWNKPGLSNDSLIMRATPESGGSMSVLTGTNYWTNYKFESDITIDSGRTGFIMGRYKDNDNYLLCGVDDSAVSFRQVVAGKDALIKSIPLRNSSNNNYHVSIDVKGNTASCSINGTTAGLFKIDPELNIGGIGFETWDPEKGKSAMTAHNINVTSSTIQ